MTHSVLLSIVSPVYQAENIVDELVRRIIVEAEKITSDYEIILVEDGSKDNSWKKIENNCNKNLKVKGIKLSRNFGQHYAITAALNYAQGDFVVVMDCDLQENPKYISDLYAKALQGNDIVYTLKKIRKHSFLKNLMAQIYFRIYGYLTDTKTANPMVGAFSMLNRKVVNAFISVNAYHRHYLLVLGTLGFQTSYVELEHEKRFAGKSSYNFQKLFKLAIDGITSQSDKLLLLSIKTGFLFFIASLTYAIIIVVNYFLIGALPGYTSLMAMLLLSTGLILISIGIVGIYIGKVFEQVKNKPFYIVDKEINISINKKSRE